MNKVILVGNLGQDGELKVLPGGQSVLSLRLATSETWKDKTTGEKKEAVEWHSCDLWGSRAESLAPHMTKGAKLVVTGSLRTRSYEKNGEKRYATNINVEDIEFAGGAKGTRAPTPAATETTADGEEIPF